MEGTAKPKFRETTNYAWVIFIGACMINLTVAAMFAMLFGVFLVPLAQATGGNMVAAATYSSISQWTNAVTVLLYGYLLTRLRGTKLTALLVVSAILVTSCPLWNGLVAPAFGNTTMFGYYIGAFLNGLAGSILPVMVPITFISNWFGPKWRGKFVGFAAFFSGLGAVMWPPLHTYVIQTYGLSYGWIMNGVILGCFAIPAALFIFRFRPEHVLPWGVKSWEELKEQESADVALYGYPPAKVFKTVAFYLLLFVIAMATFHGAFVQNQPGAAAQWLTEVGHPDAANAAMIGALMISMGAVGNMGGKLVIGFIIDKFGAGLAAALFALITGLGMVIWLVFPTTPLVLYAGACCVGFASPIMTVGMPMTIRQTFGDRTYPRIYSYVVTMQMVVGGIASPLIAIILGAFGGQYSAIYVFGGILYACMVILFTIINTFRGKYPQVDEEGNPMPAKA